MRPQKVEDQELLNGLFSVIRDKGYDGASLNELADLTGLKKASLYHRFPGGKKDIVKAVLENVDSWSQKNLVKVMNDTELTAKQKLEKAILNLNELFQNGERTCIFRSLSLDNGLTHFQGELQDGINTWIQAFTDYGLSLGLSKKEAKLKGTEVVARIQGSLMVSKILGNTDIWRSTLHSIKELYNS